MRPQDKLVFAAAAEEIGVWILVRRTNPASLQYIGKPGYVPKPIDCKAKTADLKQLAGLVADPLRCPEAFSADKLLGAKKVWDEFARENAIDKGAGRYQVVTNRNSPLFGAVTLTGKYLHGDYDLYDIVDPEQAMRNLAAVEMLNGQPHMRGPKLYQVMSFVNGRIGVDMVQHGGEAQYKDHSHQAIDAFGPGGEQCTILNEFSVRGWYEERFGGRKTIALPK